MWKVKVNLEVPSSFKQHSALSGIVIKSVSGQMTTKLISSNSLHMPLITVIYTSLTIQMKKKRKVQLPLTFQEGWIIHLLPSPPSSPTDRLTDRKSDFIVKQSRKNTTSNKTEFIGNLHNILSPSPVVLFSFLSLFHFSCKKESERKKRLQMNWKGKQRNHFIDFFFGLMLFYRRTSIHLSQYWAQINHFYALQRGDETSIFNLTIREVCPR